MQSIEELEYYVLFFHYKNLTTLLELQQIVWNNKLKCLYLTIMKVTEI